MVGDGEEVEGVGSAADMELASCALNAVSGAIVAIFGLVSTSRADLGIGEGAEGTYAGILDRI